MSAVLPVSDVPRPPVPSNPLSVRYIVGDSLQVLRSLLPASVDLILSSPPFLSLRSYLPADHPDKAKEIGSEPTPGEFLDRLLDVVEECERVLAPHGSIAFELGDTYAGSGGGGGDYRPNGFRDGQPTFEGSASKSSRRVRPGTYLADKTILPVKDRWTGARDGWPLDKSLCLIPELLRFALVYGFNPLTGRETPRWRARNVVRWARPNPPVGALADKFRPATTDIIVACKGRKRYFDLDAVRYAAPPEHERKTWNQEGPKQKAWARENGDGRERFTQRTVNEAGAPPLDWWPISTEQFKGQHYATWPRKLVQPLIEAMCPREVCVECGKPRERITKPTEAHKANLGSDMFGKRDRGARESHGRAARNGAHPRVNAEYQTLGWSDCGHGNYRRGIVLDPFAGSGTTGAVASGLGRSAILIDLDERNVSLARERVGMFLEEA